MIIGLDHIAIAVSDIEETIQRYIQDFGLIHEGTEEVETANTTTAFFPVSATKIELVHPLNGSGPIAKYLEKKGKGGLHHICFRSNDIAADMIRLKQKGYRFLNEEPQVGAHNTLIAFIDPKCTDGVLIEIAQH